MIYVFLINFEIMYYILVNKSYCGIKGLSHFQIFIFALSKSLKQYNRLFECEERPKLHLIHWGEERNTFKEGEDCLKAKVDLGQKERNE